MKVFDGTKRTPKNPKITREQIIQNGGYYDINNTWNSILTFPRYPGKLFRGRVEVFIFDDKGNVFITINKTNYRIPGGSIEKNKSKKYQVSTEAKEEARIILGKIYYTGYTYFKFFHKTYDYCPVHWDGVFNWVYAAKFGSWYHGNIARQLQDNNISGKGKFVPLSSVMDILTEDHKKALRHMKKKMEDGV